MPSLEWKLRLFFSVDLVGSTAYKVADSKSDSPEWAHTFREFFHEFPTAIEQEADRLIKNYSYPQYEDTPKPWKFSGDEILFWVELKDYTHVVSHIASFKAAIKSYPEEWQRKNVPLSLKGTAWLAGFPVTNSEIEITSENSRHSDFIGPSLDCGFRLTKFASTRKFILSADLALMLLDAIHTTELPSEHFHLFFDGKENLKGVLEGEPYPIVWLDVSDGTSDIEEQLLGVSRETKPQLLRQFLLDYVDNKLRRPFIHGDQDNRYGNVPGELEKKRKKMLDLESQMKDSGTANDEKGETLNLDPPSID